MMMSRLLKYFVLSLGLVATSAFADNVRIGFVTTLTTPATFPTYVYRCWRHHVSLAVRAW